MTNDPKHELIHYRLSQAKQACQEGEILLKESLPLGTVNRAYYAMFYAVQALLVLKDEKTSKHSGAIAFFDREFVKTGVFSRDLSKNLHLAFEMRQSSDYGELTSLDELEVKLLIQNARGFIAAVENYLQSAI